jgi:translocator protein
MGKGHLSLAARSPLLGFIAPPPLVDGRCVHFEHHAKAYLEGWAFVPVESRLATSVWRRSGKVRFVASVAVCEAAAVVGSVFTISAIPTWYAALQKPWFTPPNWLFAPVWLTLYFLMGVSLYLLWGSARRARLALGAFTVQLFLNVLWSAVFFGAHQQLYGFVVIAALWAAILATMALSYRISRGAAAALLPYLGWVTIASALNYYVWVLNS